MTCPRRRPLLLLLLLAGCAQPVAGPPTPLPPEVAGDVRIGMIDYLTPPPDDDVEADFAATFSEEVESALSACARGSRRMDLRIQVLEVARADRISMARGDAAHRVAGRVEFVEPGTRRVVGRYDLDLEIPAVSGPGALLTDRQLEVGEAFGEALCRRVIGQ